MSEPGKIGLFDKSPIPDRPRTPSKSAESLKKFLRGFGIHFKRAFGMNMRKYPMLPEEESELQSAVPPITSREFSALLFWRKSLIYIVGVLMLPGLAFELWKYIGGIVKLTDQRDKVKGVPGMSKLVDVFDTIIAYQAGTGILSLITAIAFTIGIWMAYKHWTKWYRSRRILFWSWLFYFIMPFLTALVPVRSIIADKGIPSQELMVLGVAYGMNAFMNLGPKALSLMPGILRACFIAKKIFPGASSPGWLMLLASPLYALMFFVILVVPLQIVGTFTLFLAIMGFVGAPIWLGRSGLKLALPMSYDDAITALSKARLVYYIFNGFGLLFFIVAFVDLIEVLNLGVADGFQFLISFFTTFLILSVIVTDLLIISLGTAKQMTIEVSATEPQQNYELALWDFLDEQKRDIERTGASDTGKPPRPLFK